MGNQAHPLINLNLLGTVILTCQAVHLTICIVLLCVSVIFLIPFGIFGLYGYSKLVQCNI